MNDDVLFAAALAGIVIDKERDQELVARLTRFADIWAARERVRSSQEEAVIVRAAAEIGRSNG